MSGNRSRLLGLPLEIFRMIAEFLIAPHDYFHLMLTCRSLWNRDGDVLTSCIVRDARLLHANVMAGQYSDLRQWPPNYEPIVYWCLRTRQAIDIAIGIIERYYWVYPDAVTGSRNTRLHSAAAYAIAADYFEAFELMLDMRVIPSLDVLGDQYMTWAVELADDIEIARWLVDRGVRAKPRHMYVLHDRGLVPWRSQDWHYFMFHSSQAGGINLDPEDDSDTDSDDDSDDNSDDNSDTSMDGL
ncbi:hypothetical protein K445DRAFT_10803 [Daldinia sp. EC12]|nr:hypothetical protein K445DRAFT_10803 [Daldinia sp. EC12]